MAATAATGDFFGGGALVVPRPAAVVRAPQKTTAQLQKERANKLARQDAEKRRIEAQRQANNSKVKLDRQKVAQLEHDTHKRLMADPGPEGQAYRAQQKKIHSAGIDWGLIPAGAQVLATGAAIIASGGAVAGALGATAAVSTAAAASTAATVLNSAQKGVAAARQGVKVANAVKSGNVKQATAAALKGGSDVASLTSKAGLGLSQNDKDKLKGLVPKVKLPAAAKSVAKTAKQATALKKTVTKAAAAPAAAVKKAVAKAKPKAATKVLASVKAVASTAKSASAASVLAKAKAKASPSVSSVIKTTGKLLPGVPVLPKTIKAVGVAGAASALSKAVSVASKKAPDSATAKLAASTTKATSGGGAPKLTGGVEEGYFIATSGPNKGKIDFQSRRWARAS